MVARAETDFDHDGRELAERLLCDIDPDIDPTRGDLEPMGRGAAIAALQFLWRHYMVTGARRFGDAVLRSLRETCRSAPVETSLSADALELELLTWVWRVERCPELQRRGERIATAVVTRTRVPGFGFAASVDGNDDDESVPFGGNGLMLVALIEAGSVFQRREWLALAREVFDELVPALADAGGRRDAAAGLGDYVMMSRAAIRLFEAFGKRRYLEHAEAWVRTLDASFQDGGYGACRGAESAMADGSVSLCNALMIGVLARLHALTGKPGHAERARHLAATLHQAMTRSDLTDAATLVANAQTATDLVSIEVSGDPKLPETRALMRIALDCGLPDRLVLGPDAGGVAGERPLARIRVGVDRLTPIDDAAALRTSLAPGGLAAVFSASRQARER